MPTPTVPWYLTNQTPTPLYEHVANIGYPQATLEYPSAVDDDDRLHSEELGSRYFEGHSGREPYPTPDQLIFSDGPARQVENPFIIRDYPNTSLDAISIEMEMAAIYREDVFVKYTESDDLLEDGVEVSRFGGEYAAPLFVGGYDFVDPPTAVRTDAISGYQQFAVAMEEYPADCSPGNTGCPHFSYGKTLRPGVFDVRGQGIASQAPSYMSDTYRYKWPVFFDDVSWYLFELHGVNKALADSDEFAKAVLDHNPFTETTHYPAWALDPRMVSRPYDGMGHPVVNNAPSSSNAGDEPDIPHRYYGGGLANYRNTVDPLEHSGAVQAMGELVPSLGNGFPHGRLTGGSIDGYGMYTNRKVFWGEPKFAGSDGDPASYGGSDFGNSVYTNTRNHNLTFLPLAPAEGYEPGGTLVKRGCPARRLTVQTAGWNG